MPFARFIRHLRHRRTTLSALLVRTSAVAFLYPLLGLCALRPPAPAAPQPTATVPATAVPRPTASPTATGTPSPTPMPTKRPTESPAPTSPPTETPSPTPTASETPSPTGSPRIEVPVARVIDGDTIKVVIDGSEYSVRYIGIDAPQLQDRNRAGEWLALESLNANRAMVEGRTVGLESDATDQDEYGRLRRHVWVGEQLVTAELVRLGLARVVSEPPDIRYDALLRTAEEEARLAGRGLWGAAPTATQPAGPAVERTGCDPAYPDVCIPPPPPDLDCSDIPYRRFQVLPPDPHYFDSDGDGMGCES